MNKNKIIASKELGPASLPAIEDLGGHERSQVLVIRKNLNGVIRAFKIVASMFYRLNNGQHLKVRDPVIAFCRDAFT